MRFVLFFVLWSTFFAGTTCEGQSYYFKQYQADDGLAHNSVHAIIQDKNGFIWIGTRGGLNRFDGYTFKTLKNEKSKFGNIGNNIIISLIEDKKGMLWVGTGRGIVKYNPYNEIFTPLEQAPQNYISHIIIDHHNDLYFLANNQLHKYIQNSNKVVNLKISASCIAVDSRSNILLGNDDGQLITYHPENGSKDSVRIISREVPVNLRSISKIFPAAGNTLLIGCFKQGLKSYDTKSGLIKSLILRNSDNTDIYVRDITAGENQEYWIATEFGIYIYDLVNNTCKNLRKKAGDPYSLPDNAVYTVCKDNDGGMWAGTYFGGLGYYSKRNARFEKYYPLLGSNSISGNAIREICPDEKGSLWIGTEDAGINKLNLKTGIFTNYTAKGKKGDVSYPNIHGLFAFNNQLFIGPFLHGLEIMDIKRGIITDRFKTIVEKNEATSDFVLSIYVSRDGTIYVGTGYNTRSGLFVFNQDARTFKRIEQIPNSSVYDIYEDSFGYIWTGSLTRGAFYYHPKTGKHGNISFGDQTKDKTISQFAVCGIMEDSNHAMWFTTQGSGLIRLSPDRKVIKKFNTENGLPTNILFRALEDNSKCLWISSFKGMICLDLRTEKIKIYTKSNGLIADQFNFSSAYKDPNGRMYFGSVRGMISFNPKDFEQKDTAPPTFITGFQINNKEVLPNIENSPLSKSISYTDTIVVAHDQNNFSIEFATLNYSSPEVTRYEYVMKGVDQATTYLNNNRKAYFTDLSPGSYTFLVRAKSNVGSWTGKECRLFIKILPPFWKSITAYICYLLMIATGLFLAIRYYHRYIERKNLNKLQLFEHEKEKEIYQAKIEFFTNIAHEIQTPLTLILGPVEMMLEEAKEQPLKSSLLMVEKNANRLAKLTNQLLDFRKTEMHQFGLNFVNTDINNLLKEQINAFEQEAQKSNISLDLELPKTHIIAFADREALIKIFNNLISNAIKYGTNKVNVRLSTAGETEGRFNVTFANDGKGIPQQYRAQIFEPFFRLYGKDKPGTGIGLSLAKSLAELHNGSLMLLEGDADKVVFELILPIHQKFEFKLSSWKKIK
ncbi:signal transduction histidine kinase/ligand-binding sensor domain-containing protein [Pedobacter sp. W3I1]|uniref:ligand-binding sensor domain-containing protein n=1 Tax=Pedobacter sp. W3I1 TaxID=3042291 RepID=UPI0027806997|nr:sensor histidine kinase [Pedobacter sp. W3I1]MDQ0638740.1 signal transduction histidine kinase/ligand-binding sensor domain-containing protein [Pedobacter sp. W3I1]